MMDLSYGNDNVVNEAESVKSEMVSSLKKENLEDGESD